MHDDIGLLWGKEQGYHGRGLVEEYGGPLRLPEAPPRGSQPAQPLWACERPGGEKTAETECSAASRRPTTSAPGRCSACNHAATVPSRSLRTPPLRSG